MDCCQYFAALPQLQAEPTASANRVSLWTDDKNLALQAEIHGIPTWGNKAFSMSELVERISPALHVEMLRLSSPADEQQTTRFEPSRKDIGPAPLRQETSIHAPAATREGYHAVPPLRTGNGFKHAPARQ